MHCNGFKHEFFSVKQKNYTRAAFISLHGKPVDINDGMYEQYSDAYNTNSLVLARELSSEIIAYMCVCRV